MKIVTIVGARPQFIKASVVSKEIRKKHEEILVHTGQHYDYNMSQSFFDELNIPKPNYQLDLKSSTVSERMGEMIKGIAEIILAHKPDLVIVYGDTDSTLAGAIAANKNDVPIAHIEAGLRSYDKNMPEEFNRVLVDHASKMLFCPTDIAVQNLKKEGITESTFNTGDVMFDSIINFGKMADNKILDDLKINSKQYLLATVHRKSNTENISVLKTIFEAFKECGEEIVFPIHPRTLKCIKEHNIAHDFPNVKIISPVTYLQMISLEKNAKKIITDSGGVQKEAFFLKVPCITLRENTEWTETVENGWNVLAGTQKDSILNAIKNFKPSKEQVNHYGDGNASRIICEIIDKYYS